MRDEIGKYEITVCYANPGNYGVNQEYYTTEHAPVKEDSFLIIEECTVSDPRFYEEYKASTISINLNSVNKISIMKVTKQELSAQQEREAREKVKLLLREEAKKEAKKEHDKEIAEIKGMSLPQFKKWRDR